MTSPDLSPYNGLLVYDLDSVDLVNRALLDAVTKTPDWVPRDGNWEMVLLEACSLVAAEIVYAINRVPDATISGVLQLLGVTPSAGSQATATATFTLSDALGYTIPAGTAVALPVADGQVQFTSNVDLTIPPGSTSGTIGITSVDNTAEANGATAGTSLVLVDSVPSVDTVALATDVSAGSDPETDADFISRGITRFARLNDTLVLPGHFTDEVIATFPQVERATTIDNWDADTASSTPGHVTVAVAGGGGASLSSGDKDAILADLQSKALVNLVVHVIDPDITVVDVTVSVHSAPGEDPGTVHDSIINTLRGYLSPDSWPWDATVRVNKLLNVIENVTGVDYVDTLTLPASDVALSGAAPLPAAGTILLTVTPS